MEQISSILQPFYHSWIGSDGFAHPAANHPIDADIGVESEPEANSLPFAVIVLVFDDDMVRQADCAAGGKGRSEEHTSELQSLMRISYAVFCLKKKNIQKNHIYIIKIILKRQQKNFQLCIIKETHKKLILQNENTDRANTNNKHKK